MQVPQSVAEEWHAACSRDGGPRTLGRLNKRQRTLELSDSLVQRGGGASRYEVQPAAGVPTLVFSRSGQHYGAHGWASLSVMLVFRQWQGCDCVAGV